ncbi:MAG: hypothetical protein IPH45_19060 [Bacteroidales bacterium]|nr:hypothetical protein [Bacteroidales bacterium]
MSTFNYRKVRPGVSNPEYSSRPDIWRYFTWTISTESPYDGLYCSKSGTIGHSQSTEMSIQLNINSAGTISFFRKVSSESGYDYLKFLSTMSSKGNGRVL